MWRGKASSHISLPAIGASAANDYVSEGHGMAVSKDLPFKAKRAVLIFFSAWLIVVMAAPLLLPYGSVTDLSGASGTIDNSDIINGMNPFSAAIYFIGDGNCHQLAERSLFLNGNQMPFCARDVGIFAGLVAGMTAVLLFSPRFRWPVLILMVVPILIDGGIQLTGVWESNNTLRLITGALGGMAAAYFMGYVADRFLTLKTPVSEK